MKRYELKLAINDGKKYVDKLIVCLARFGYSPYISWEGDCVCFEVSDEELTEIKERN